jgi:hypothetical protein
MSTIRITPRRMTRKANPPPIHVTSEGVVRPGNSGSTIGSPPRRYDHDRLPEDRGYGVLALEVARQGLPRRLSVREPYMFINPLNMCYRNSVLAMLLNIEPFLGWLRLYSQVSLAGKGRFPRNNRELSLQAGQSILAFGRPKSTFSGNCYRWQYHARALDRFQQ